MTEAPPLSKFVLSIAVLYALMLLAVVNLPAIGGSSEAREAHIAKLIYETGELVLPLRNGLVPSKPPLFHWIAAALGWLRGGVTPGVARTVSVLAASATLLTAMLLAAALAAISVGTGGSARRGVHCALMSAAALSLTYGFTRMAAEARVDMLFSFFANAALLAALPAIAFWTAGIEADGNRRRPGLTLFFVFCGLAVLAKGPLGVVLPVLQLSAALFFLLPFRRAAAVLLRPRLGWLLFILIAVPWYLLAWQQGSSAFVSRQLLFENIQRMTGGEFMNSKPFWFYLPVVLADAFPWSVLALLAMAFYGRGRRAAYGMEAGSGAIARRRLADLPLVWFCCGLFLFSLASGKRGSYLLPLWPQLAVLLALYGQRWLASLTDRGWLRLRSAGGRFNGALIGFLLALVLSAELLALPWTPADPALAEMLRWMGTEAWRLQAGLATAAAGCYIAARAGRPVFGVWFACLAALVFGLFFWHRRQE